MRLCELFAEPMNIEQQLQQTALDIITPLLANKVPFITVQAVIDELRGARPGLVIDRAFVMDLMDPDKIKAVSKIEGDRIYLQAPPTDEFKAGEDQAENDIQRVKNSAIKKAQTDVKAANAPGPTA